MGKTIRKTILPLDKDERLRFVNAILKAQKANPNLGWKPLFEQARKVLAPGRMSVNIDHPNKIDWIKPMLGLEAPKQSNKKPQVYLDDSHKKIFAQAIFDLRQKNPQMSVGACIQEANKSLPAELQFSKHKDSFNQFLWLRPMLEQLEKPARKSPLTADERLAFAKAFFEFKKANPQAGSVQAIRHANSLLPDDRKVGANIDSVKQIIWIIPLLEQLENPPKVKGRWECALSDKEKEEFAAIVYRLRKGGATWTRCMKEANGFMPEGHKIADSVINPSSVPWLQRALVKLEEADKSKVVIDNRSTLPKAEAPAPEYKKERKHSETKTYWNDEDKDFFAEITYQLKMCNPGWGWQKILDEANMEMPGHKRRPKMPPSVSQILWLGAMLDKIARRPAPQREPEPVKIPEIAVPAPAPVPTMDMQALMMAAMEKVIRENMAAGGGMNMTAMMSPQPTKVEAPARKKVIVVGLLPIQTNDIQKRFGHKFDFKFIGSNTPNQQIRDSMKNADIGILMTRFVSHPTQAALRDHLRVHQDFSFCNGNSTALENLLEEKAAKLDGQ